MLILKRSSIKFLVNKIQLEYIYTIIVVFMLIFIFYFTYLKLSRPVTLKQYQTIVDLSGSATYLGTQEMAFNLLHGDVITQIKYFKLIQAYQFEYNQVKNYPAVSIEN